MRSLVLCLMAGFALPATATAATGPTIREETNIVFGKGGDTDLKLDLAMPAEGAGPFPAVVCIHGGGWVGGKRQEMTQTIRTLAGRGFVAVTPDYRLATAQARFPSRSRTAKRPSVGWRNAAAYKIDPNHIGAVGFAAGGHLACMLGVTDKNDGLDGNGGNADWSSQVQAVVSFFGPTDLTANDWGLDVTARNLVPLLGGTAAEKPEAYRKASPLNYAGKNTALLLLIHGAADKMVPLDQSRRLAEKVASAGGSAQLVVVEGEGHGFRPEKLVQCLGKMVTFFDSASSHDLRNLSLAGPFLFANSAVVVGRHRRTSYRRGNCLSWLSYRRPRRRVVVDRNQAARRRPRSEPLADATGGLRPRFAKAVY